MARLIDVIKAVGVSVPIEVGLMREEPSMTLFNLAGGEELVYMNGEREKTYNIGILMKHESDSVCFNELTNVYQKLENLKELKSKNDSFDFSTIITANLPNKTGVEPKGLNVWSADFKIKILIYKGVDY